MKPQTEQVRAFQIIKTLFETPGVVNLSDKDDFEVQPDVYSSVYINLKSLASSYKSRIIAGEALAAKAKDFAPDYIGGMELGGCYFASNVADRLAKELFFYRKSDKKYNIKNCFAGNIPRAGSNVVIVDDVLSSGNTVARGVRELKELGCKVAVVCVFSYCWDQRISENLGASVSSLSNAEGLMSYGTENGLMTRHNVQLINEYIAREESRLVRPQ